MKTVAMSQAPRTLARESHSLNRLNSTAHTIGQPNSAITANQFASALINLHATWTWPAC
jgi:hypothetical protein